MLLFTLLIAFAILVVILLMPKEVTPMRCGSTHIRRIEMRTDESSKIAEFVAGREANFWGLDMSGYHEFSCTLPAGHEHAHLDTLRLDVRWVD